MNRRMLYVGMLAMLAAMSGASGFGQEIEAVEADEAGEVIEPMVYIESLTVRVPAKAAKAPALAEAIAGKQTRFKRDAFEKLLATEGVRTIFGGAVMTTDGNEALIRLATNALFPEAWSAEKILFVNQASGAAPAQAGIKVVFPPFPNFGEPTELGMRVIATPIVDPDRRSVALSLLPLIQFHTGFTDDGDGRRMPVLASLQLETQSLVRRDEILVTGGSFTPADGPGDGHYLLHAVSASLILPDGTPYRNRQPKVAAPGEQTDDTPQINVVVQFIEIGSADLLALGDGKRLVGPPPPGFAKKLLDSGKARLLDESRVACTSGQTAFVKSGQSRHFPLSWSDPGVIPAKADEDDKRSSPGDAVRIVMPAPELGEANHVGGTLETICLLDDDHRTITVQLSPSLVEHTGWTVYPYRASVGDEVKSVDIRMPELARKHLVTTVRIFAGETLCLGYAEINTDPKQDFRKPSGEYRDGKAVFCFLTANLVGADVTEKKVEEKGK